MAAATRRLERRPDDLLKLLAGRGFEVGRVIDLSGHEQSGRFLEGTGSLVLDRPRRRAFAAIGPRTDREALAEFEQKLGYSTFTFDAADRSGKPIYHTNVMLSVGTRFAVLCLETVPEKQREQLASEIEATGRAPILVDYAQMRQFACNVIELRSGGGKPVIAMSATARASFRPDQLRRLEGFASLVDVAIPTIEAVGGGSLRCMTADINLPRR
jgi:hypothetical protein